MVIIPAAVLLILAGASYFVFFRDISPLLTVSKAIDNLTAEISERTEASPLKALEMLSDTMEDGSLTISFDYIDTWDYDDVSGTVLFLSNKDEKDFAMSAAVSYYDLNIGFEAYLNNERIAFGSRLLDNNYYGFSYSTFRDDIRPFGWLIGIDEEIMDQIADIVDILSDALNGEESAADDAIVEQFDELFNDFLSGIEMTSDKSEIKSGGEDVKCTKVRLVITQEALLGLVNDVYELLENEETFRGLSGISGFSLQSDVFSGMYYEEFMSILRESIMEFERSFSGEIALTFYIGRGDRLLRAEIDADIIYDDDRTITNIVFDFGASAQDIWFLDISLTDDNGLSTYSVVWIFQELPDSFENTLIISSPPDQHSLITLTSSWPKDSGVFKLAFIDEDSYGDPIEVSGTFIAGGDTFRLNFDNLFPPDDYRSLTIEIVVEPGADIDHVEFINIDQWSETMEFRFGPQFDQFGINLFELLPRYLF